MLADPGFRRLVVVGASADGVLALKHLVHGLPVDFPAPVLVVLHVGSHSQLPAILMRAGHLPAVHPFDREPIYPGRVYVAPPAHHMRVEPGCVRVMRDSANHHKPSIDELFRSAAAAYGAAVIGVVLTGYLVDGSAGMQAIKQAGGTTIVQDPADAGVPAMPLAAIARTEIDHRCTIAALGPLLCRLVT